MVQYLETQRPGPSIAIIPEVRSLVAHKLDTLRFMTNSSPTPTEKDPSLVIQKYVKDGWDLAIRRKWLILLCVILGASIGGVLAWYKVDLYRSETVILVEQQKITEKYVPSVVGGSTAERVSTITQQVLSRTHLHKIIDEFQVYPKEINQNGYEPVIEGLRKNIKIQTKGSGGQVEAFYDFLCSSGPHDGDESDGQAGFPIHRGKSQDSGAIP
jgi:hypothetical protein